MKVQEKDIQQALKKFGLKAEIQEAQKQVMATLHIAEGEYSAFFRPLEKGGLLHMVTFLPCSVLPKAEMELGRFLHLINKELDMPGFCWDDDSRTVFYRIVVPCLNHEIEEPLLKAYVEIIQRVCTMFGTLIHAVAIGAMTIEEIFTHAEKAQGK